MNGNHAWVVRQQVGPPVEKDSFTMEEFPKTIRRGSELHGLRSPLVHLSQTGQRVDQVLPRWHYSAGRTPGPA